MTLAPGWAAIPSRIRRDLSIGYDQRLSLLEVKRLQPHRKTPFHIENGKVDILSIIPEKTHRGYRICVDNHEKDGESWLSVWYCHLRGAAREIELKQFVDISKLGQLLGQLQAEGDKNFSWVAFKNSSISEHADFVSALRELGVFSCISARCSFNPNKSSEQAAREYSEEYRRTTSITISSINKMDGMRGTLAAYTYVRSTILAQILLFAMDEIRSGSIKNEPLRQNFIAKLLSGDGTLDVRIRARKLDVKLRIVDQNLRYLDDYAALLSSEGFRCKVVPDRITLRSNCTWLKLLKLYRIGAFRNGRNWIKLLCSIMIAAKGKQNRGYKRVSELSRLQDVTSDNVSSEYKIGRRSANLWIGNMRKLGLLQKTRNASSSKGACYSVTKLGLETSLLLREVEREYNGISRGSDPVSVLDLIKVPSRRRRSTE
jgi:hypothetical protein